MNRRACFSVKPSANTTVMPDEQLERMNRCIDEAIEAVKAYSHLNTDARKAGIIYGVAALLLRAKLRAASIRTEEGSQHPDGEYESD